MQYTKSEIEEYLRSNLPDKWSDKIGESIVKSSDEIVKVFTHVDNFYLIHVYLMYLSTKSNTIEEQIYNSKNDLDMGFLVICRALKEHKNHEDMMCQYALDATHNNPLSIKDKSISNLICNIYRFDEEDYKKALTFITPKELCELYIESRGFDKFDYSFYNKFLKDLGDEKHRKII